MDGYYKAQAAKARGDDFKVFDWHKAARLICEHKPDVASAGLAGDWEYTGGTIYRDGEPLTEDKSYVYLASLWATPELDMDGDVQECWVYQKSSPGWNEKTFWPESALAILRTEATP